jgi:hypothetical protein
MRQSNGGEHGRHVPAGIGDPFKDAFVIYKRHANAASES